MTIQVDNALPPNVVEIGNEITQGVVDGLMSASPSASSSNPYITVNGVSGVYLPLAGGTMTGDIGVNYNDLNQVTSIVFADSTVQTTASVGAGTWGSITGTLSSQTDLQNALNAKLTASSNLSDLANTSTARTNLGLGTMATATATDYLDKAGNLSGLANTATARTNLGVAYATDAQVIAGTSTTTVLSPSSGQQLRPIFNYGPIELGMYSWSTAVTGGFFVSAAASMNKFINNQTAVGYGVIYLGLTGNLRNGSASTVIDFSKKILYSQRCGVTNPISGDTNTTWRLMIGKSSSSTVAGDLTVRGFGFKRVGSGALQLMVHNGTTLTTVTSSFTPTNTNSFDVTFNSDGAGNVIMLVNGSQVASSSAGPTANGSTNASIFFELENTAISAGSGFVNFQHPRIDLGV